jgi:phytoene synthase
LSDPVLEQSREMIRQGSKSFFAAARIFDAPTRASAYMLYAWCRHCDDVVDLQELGHGSGESTPKEARRRLATLESETERALDGEEMEHPAFAGLQRVVQKHEIPRRYPLHLLEGFRMDVEGRRYDRLDETLSYCYHVAGVVGVMMAYVMGVRDGATLDRASDLGIGFQMTNISRDVMEDAAVGRVYLPRRWLAEAGVPASEIWRHAHRPAVASVVKRFLAEADRYYRSSAAGISRLRGRHAWAIAAAKCIYSDIGRVVRERGSQAWDQRAVVSTARKLVLLGDAALEALWATTFERRTEPPPREGLFTRP